MDQQSKPTGLSSLIGGLQKQESGNQAQNSSSIFSQLQMNQDKVQILNTINSSKTEEYEEVKQNSSSKGQTVLFKQINKQSKEHNSLADQSSKQQQQQKNQQRVTGAGVLLWEYFRLNDEEYKKKQDILKELNPQREGYTILLFGQKEKKGKFKDQILYTDPGGKIDENENSETIASRELYEESCGTFLIDEKNFDVKKSFRMGGSYILYNLLLATDEGSINLDHFNSNYLILSNLQETPIYWLESQLITRIFVSELKTEGLFGATNLLELKDAYGNSISIGRRCIAILRALIKSPNVYNFHTNKIQLNQTITLKCQKNEQEQLLSQFPWIKNTTMYQSI